MSSYTRLKLRAGKVKFDAVCVCVENARFFARVHGQGVATAGNEQNVWLFIWWEKDK